VIPFQGFPCCRNCFVEAHVCRVGNVTHLRLLVREHPELAIYRDVDYKKTQRDKSYLRASAGLRVLVTTQTALFNWMRKSSV
jgi:hypothetical protein